MENDDFDNNSENPEFFSIKWSSKDWLGHLQKSDNYILSFKDSYAKHRMNGKSLEEVCQMNGYSLSIQENAEEIETDNAFEPWTLLNHPLYIINISILEFVNMRLDELMQINEMSAGAVWNIAKTMSQLSKNLSLAINSTDLGESVLAKCHYKRTLLSINEALDKIQAIQAFPIKKANYIKEEIYCALFDLRQICLDLSNENENKYYEM